MKTHASGNELLVVSRQDLIVPIKRSHQFLLAQISTTLLIIPTVAILFYLMTYYIPDSIDLSDFSLMTWFLIVLGIVAVIWIIKKSYTFIRSSKYSLTEIEQATTTIQLSTGLTTYVKQLSNFLRVPSLLFGKKPPVTLPEGLKHLEKEMNKSLFRSLMEFSLLATALFGMVFFFQLANPTANGQFLLYVVIGSLIAIFVIRFGMTLKWRPLVKQWIHVVQGLRI